MHFQPLHDTAYIPGSACSSRLLLLLGQRSHCFLLPLPAALIPVPFLHIVHSTTWGAGGAADAIGKGIPSVPSLPAALEAGGSSGAAAAAPADTFSPCTVIDRREEDGSRTVAFEVGMGGGEARQRQLKNDLRVFEHAPLYLSLPLLCAGPPHSRLPRRRRSRVAWQASRGRGHGRADHVRSAPAAPLWPPRQP